MARASTTEKADRTGETLQMKNFDVDIIETRLEQGQIDDNTVLRLVERFLVEGTIGVTYEVVTKSNRHPHNPERDAALRKYFLKLLQTNTFQVNTPNIYLVKQSDPLGGFGYLVLAGGHRVEAMKGFDARLDKLNVQAKLISPVLLRSATLTRSIVDCLNEVNRTSTNTTTLCKMRQWPIWNATFLRLKGGAIKGGGGIKDDEADECKERSIRNLRRTYFQEAHGCEATANEIDSILTASKLLSNAGILETVEHALVNNRKEIVTMEDAKRSSDWPSLSLLKDVRDCVSKAQTYLKDESFKKDRQHVLRFVAKVAIGSEDGREKTPFPWRQHPGWQELVDAGDVGKNTVMATFTHEKETAAKVRDDETAQAVAHAQRVMRLLLTSSGCPALDAFEDKEEAKEKHDAEKEKVTREAEGVDRDQASLETQARIALSKATTWKPKKSEEVQLVQCKDYVSATVTGFSGRSVMVNARKANDPQLVKSMRVGVSRCYPAAQDPQNSPSKLTVLIIDAFVTRYGAKENEETVTASKAVTGPAASGGGATKRQKIDPTQTKLDRFVQPVAAAADGEEKQEETPHTVYQDIIVKLQVRAPPGTFISPGEKEVTITTNVSFGSDTPLIYAVKFKVPMLEEVRTISTGTASDSAPKQAVVEEEDENFED